MAAVRDFDHTIGSLVPPVFEAYARVFHPARRQGEAGADVEVPWAEVAAFNGRHAHAGMQWTAIIGSWKHLHEDTQPGVWDVEPDEGSLPAAPLRGGGEAGEHLDQRLGGMSVRRCLPARLLRWPRLR